MEFVGARLKEESLHPKSRNLEVLVLARVPSAEPAAELAEVSVPSAPFLGVSQFSHDAGEPVSACSGTHQ